MDGKERWLAAVTGAFDEFMISLAAYLPTLLGALMVVILGWLLAVAAKMAVLRVGAAVGRAMGRTSIAGHLRLVRLPWPLSVVVANILFWLIVIFSISLAAHILDLPGIGAWLSVGLGYLPRIFASAAILLAGYAIAGFLRDWLVHRFAQTELGRALGQAIFVLVNAVAIIVAVEQIGIDVSLIKNILVISAATMLGGMALAFGLGAGSSVDNIIASHYLKKHLAAGQRVRLDKSDGVIIEITPTAVVLDTAEGRAVVPAKLFNDRVAVLLGAEGDAGAK